MKKILLGLLGVLLVGVLLGYLGGILLQQEQPTAERIPIVVEEELPEQQVTLYFGDVNGAYLVAETRLIDGCDDDRDCIRSVLEELRSGSRQDLQPVLPEQTGILEIELENDLVRVDFSRHLSDFHPGGSLSELLTVYSLVDSLSENFPYLRQMQITVDGQLQQTLKGHVRIDQPVYADFSYTHPPALPAAEEGSAGDGGQTANQEEPINE